jgi:hypothetical protein
MVTNTIVFPKYSGIKCNMIPFVQGDSSSLPEIYQPYAEIIDENFLEKGEIGFLTIHESFVQGGQSQRGYNSAGHKRNVHIEVGRSKESNRWGSSWGKGSNTRLDDDTKVLIANSISGTCRVWDAIEMSDTLDGDLSAYIDRYPENTGILLLAGEVAKISIFTPHECVVQQRAGARQFFRIVGSGVKGREPYFTENPMVAAPYLFSDCVGKGFSNALTQLIETIFFDDVIILSE